ncbi:hypothetical protein [uncultured Selenomonas sp.]|uniref:hypothetical protein n=1 Tax=uncultured Selenomonas sp. TaxID=159275 RepID=UPI00258BCC04|nr:hypothetical protein [uncultured Selenomonas sp.]
MATMKTPKNKANNVKDLTITKVDFVDAGANQRANITLFKRNPTKGGEKMSNPVKKFISTMAKHLGISESETAAGIQAIAKDSGDAQTFNTMVGAMMQRKIFSQVWDITDALGSSLRSILDDDEVTDKAALMKQSVDEFSAIWKSCIDQWAAGNVAMLSPQKAEASDLEKSIAVERAEAVLKAAGKQCAKADDVEPDQTNPDGTPKSTPKKVDGSAGGSTPPKKNKMKKAEEEPDMKINKSKLTPEERAFYDAIVKKAGEPEGVQPTGEAGIEKHAPESGEKSPSDRLTEALKSLPKEVSDVLQDLQKRAEAAENREMEEVAKKYEILGKKPEELAPVLKNLKKNSPEGYEATINALDQAVEATKASGMFGEIGKRGVAGQNGSAWAQIEKKAADIRKAQPTMEYHESIDLACQQNPDLVHEYENAN